MNRPTRYAGIARSVQLGSLNLDSQNPRIPESLRSESQSDLAVVLEMGFDAFSVAQSIADFGYFQGEPLIAIPHPQVEDQWIVVEGNRRLTALLGLADQEIRSEFAEPDKWDSVAQKAGLSPLESIPIIEHTSREATHVEVARAHVVGKLQWQPYMQAKFIAARVAEGRTLAEVADLIGVTKSKAADLYRDQAVVAQAQELGLATSEIEKAFSLLSVAMGITKLRDHIGAPLGSRLTPGDNPIPTAKTQELGELMTWIFGDEDNEPKISDSRQMSQLGNVAASDVGLAALRSGLTLEESKQKVAAAGMDPYERLLQRLNAGKNALLHASDDLSDFVADEQVLAALEDVEAVVESLRNTIAEASNGSSPSA